MTRIVSLIPSATEIVAALGAADQLVGRSHECDYPAQVQQLPICTAPKFNPDGSSSEIDQAVKTLVEQSLSVYKVDTELLNELAPDVIITQTQCEVCAVSLSDVEAAVCEITSSAPRIVPLSPNWLEDVWNDIQHVADALNLAAQGQEFVARGKESMAMLADIVQQQTRSKPSVVCVEWIEPLMAAGNWMPQLVKMAGGHDVFGVAGEHSPWIEWAQIQQADPDMLVVMPCGYDIEKSQSEMKFLTEREGWTDLRAVKTGQVYITDGNQYFNRPGPRLVESLEILAEIFHPDLFKFGHEDRGWVKIAN